MDTYQENLKKVAQYLKQHNDFLIVSHVHPDGDTISSALAMAHILKTMGKSYYLVNQDPIPTKFTFLPMANQIKTATAINNKFSNVITLDVADRSRTGDISHLLLETNTVINIDHHPTNDMFGDLNLILPTAAATAEVMYDLITEMDIPFTKDIATCIYTGILTDTGGFRYSNTTSKIMKIAANMLEHGILPGEIAEITLEAITKNYIDVLKHAFENIQILESGKIAWTTLTKENLQSLASMDDTEGVVNYMRNIEGVEVGIFFKEVDLNQYKVSLRSKKMIDVGTLAKGFGGGGHKRAAGFTYNGSLDKLKIMLLAKITEAKGWNEFA